MQTLIQIILSTFILGAIYALGAVGLTLIFGISGILNLTHGAIILIAALAAWVVSSNLHLGLLSGILSGIVASLVLSYLVYLLVVVPINRSRKISHEELPVFQLVVTLMAALLIQSIIDWKFGAVPISTPQLVTNGVAIANTFVPFNSLAIGVIAWLVLFLLWLLISFTKVGKALLAASMSLKGLAIVGYDVRKINIIVWGLYGLLTGIAGVLLASFTGASGGESINLTAVAFTIVILGGLGSIMGSLVGAYILALLSTLTSYLINPAWSQLPGLLVLIVILYIRPQGIFGRY